MTIDVPLGRHVFVVSGPSGVGKDALLATALPLMRGARRVVTWTTRKPAQGEVDGVDYDFVTHKAFKDAVDRGELLEYAMFAGNMYGTPLSGVTTVFATRNDAVLKIDVQGAASVRAAIPAAVLVFVSPPSWAVLEQRIRSRARDDSAAIAMRLDAALRELGSSSGYDYEVVNRQDEIAAAAADLASIVRSTQLRMPVPSLASTIAAAQASKLP